MTFVAALADAVVLGTALTLPTGSNASIGGTLAAGAGGAASLLLSGAAPNPTIKAVGTNAGIQIFPTGTGEIFFGQHGSGVQFFSTTTLHGSRFKIPRDGQP